MQTKSFVLNADDHVDLQWRCSSSNSRVRTRATQVWEAYKSLLRTGAAIEVPMSQYLTELAEHLNHKRRALVTV